MVFLGLASGLTLVLPFFIIFRTLDLIDSRTGLIIAYCSFLLPLSAWMMKSYFEGIPVSLDRWTLVPVGNSTTYTCPS